MGPHTRTCINYLLSLRADFLRWLHSSHQRRANDVQYGRGHHNNTRSCQQRQCEYNLPAEPRQPSLLAHEVTNRPHSPKIGMDLHVLWCQHKNMADSPSDYFYNLLSASHRAVCSSQQSTVMCNVADFQHM